MNKSQKDLNNQKKDQTQKINDQLSLNIRRQNIKNQLAFFSIQSSLINNKNQSLKNSELPLSLSGNKKTLSNLQYLQYTKQIDLFLQEAQKMLKDNQTKSLVSQDVIQKVKKYKIIMKKIDSNLEEMNKDNYKGWTVIGNNGSSGSSGIGTLKQKKSRVKLSVKIQKDTIQTKYQGQFLVNPFNMCVLFKQVDLYHRWMPFCTESKIAKQRDLLEEDVYLKFKIPLLNERYLFFHGIGIDRIKKNQSLIIYCQGINIPMPLNNMSSGKIKQIFGFDPRDFDSQIQKNSPLIMNSFIVELTYVKSHTVNIKTYGKLTTRMAKIPNWLINYLMKQISTTLIERIVKQANSFKYTPWQKELKKKSKEGFYSYLGKRINEWTNDTTARPKL